MQWTGKSRPRPRRSTAAPAVPPTPAAAALPSGLPDGGLALLWQAVPTCLTGAPPGAGAPPAAFAKAGAEDATGGVPGVTDQNGCELDPFGTPGACDQNGSEWDSHGTPDAGDQNGSHLDPFG